MGDNGNNKHDEIFATLELPIQQMLRQAPMKNISPLILPKFYGKSTKYLDGFLFEFYILYRSYYYTTSEPKFKKIPATLKGNGLRWFMSLGGEIVTTWDQMK